MIQHYILFHLTWHTRWVLLPGTSGERKARRRPSSLGRSHPISEMWKISSSSSQRLTRIKALSINRLQANFTCLHHRFTTWLRSSVSHFRFLFLIGSCSILTHHLALSSSFWLWNQIHFQGFIVFFPLWILSQLFTYKCFQTQKVPRMRHSPSETIRHPRETLTAFLVLKHFCNFHRYLSSWYGTFLLTYLIKNFLYISYFNRLTESSFTMQLRNDWYFLGWSWRCMINI